MIAVPVAASETPVWRRAAKWFVVTPILLCAALLTVAAVADGSVHPYMQGLVGESSNAQKTASADDHPAVDQFATTARPEGFHDRCYAESRWQSPVSCAGCGDIFEAVSISRNPLSCWRMCCPRNPPEGTCYEEDYCLRGCHPGYVNQAYPAGSPLSCSKECCLGQEACFWYQKSFPFCGCPGETYTAQTSGSSCTWALCCPKSWRELPHDQPPWTSNPTTRVPTFDQGVSG